MVLSAGVIFNLILAWIFISLSLFIGVETQKGNYPEKYESEQATKILGVKKDFPAEKPGLKGGEIIEKISAGSEFVFNKKADEYIKFLREHSEGVEIVYRDNLKTNKIHRVKIKEFQDFNGKKIAGIGIVDTAKVKIPFFEAFYYGAIDTWKKLKEITLGLIQFFGQVFSLKANLDDVSGPVGIVKYVGNAAENGLVSLILFTALLSINLAVINFLPFPALDGGRALFVLIEAITRKKIPTNIFNWVNGLGFLFLIVLMIIITINDIMKLF